MTVLTALTATYQPDSQLQLSLVGFADGSGTLLTSANGSAKVTLTNSGTGATLVAAAAMTYSGTPGRWDYLGTADKWPDFASLAAVLAGYDNTGATLYLSQDITLDARHDGAGPNPMPRGTYSRNSLNTFTFPAFGPPGGALLDNTNSLGKLLIATVAGSVVLAATSMTYNSGPKTWTYNAAASLFGAGQRLIATCQGWDVTGSTTLYRTSRILLLDGG